MMKMRERYENDPMFRNLVDCLVDSIQRAQITPTEAREAAMLAQIIYEDRNPRPIVFSRADYLAGKI